MDFEKCFLFSILFLSTHGILFCFAGKSCECKPLVDCAFYSNQRYIDYNSLPYCGNRNDLVVCCPKPQTTESVDYSIPYIADCEKWRKQIYDKCPEQSLIVAGDDATAREFPHMALIGKRKGEEIDWLCGGALISPKFVITAEHCIDEEYYTHYTVRLGELDFNRTDDDTKTQDFKIAKIVYYETESEDTPINKDIILLELNGTAEINRYVVPICLPLTNGSEFNRFYAAGWGKLGSNKNMSTLLQKVILERFGDSKCFTGTGNEHAPTQICCGSVHGKRDTCSNDSGSPLFMESKIFACMYEIHGLLSDGGYCGEVDTPSVYTRIHYFVDWIEKKVWDTTTSDEQEEN